MAGLSPQARTIGWNVFRVLFALLAISRLHALLVYLNVVPDYPDPISDFIRAAYAKAQYLMDTALIAEGSEYVAPEYVAPVPRATTESQLSDLGIRSLVLGNVVFAGLLRFYAPPKVIKTAAFKQQEAAREAEKKKAAGKGSLLKAAEDEKSKYTAPPKATAEERLISDANSKRYIIILGRLGQCGIFLAKSLRGDEEHRDLLLRHSVNMAIGVVLALLEVSGINWDGGYVKRMTGKEDVVVIGGAKREEEAKVQLR